MAESKIKILGIDCSAILENPPSNDKNAPCMLLVHTLMACSNMFDTKAQALRLAGYTTLRYDHAEHNHTYPARVGKHSIHMDDLVKHMHQIVKERTGREEIKAVVGCSIGEFLALRYAMMFPAFVDRVVSVAAPGMRVPEAAPRLWAERIELFEEDQRTGGDRLCSLTVDRWFPHRLPEDEDVRAEALRLFKTCSIKGYKMLADTIRDYDYSDEVSEIEDVKYLVIEGSEDAAASPQHLEEVAGKMKQGRYVLMKGAGHLPPMHKVDNFEELMLEFLGLA